MHVPTNAVHTPPTRACVCLHPYARAREENTNRIETNTLPSSDLPGFSREHLPHTHCPQVVGHSEASYIVY